VDKCPDDPEDFDQFQDEDGCPDPDNDQDGILDVDDLCPNDPEDKDGFEDEDGCPDLDNDKDRILDKDDKCPNEPETYNGFEDEDGCPDRGRVVVTDTSIEILDMIYFEYDKAIIKKESYPILDAVAATLQGNPSIQLVEIQGHTDERGNDAYNLDLSDRRAAAVKTYLEGQGVDGKRLTSQGYGETQPLVRESNEKAWAKNRRVAFLILKRATD
jgi:outer membrane protein OmpA-like peptidoglycan-associated protein